MKNSKVTFALSLFLSLCFNAMQAQSVSNFTDDQKEAVISQLKVDKERLALTPEQEGPFIEISKKYALKLKDLKASDENRKDKFKKLKEIQGQKNEDIKSMLSNQQFITYLEIQSERKAKLKERRNK